ncbi:hypothetical protein ES705_50400 [subsurface metagenome]
MASDVTFSGEFRFGFTTLFDPLKDVASYGKLELDIAAAVDDYNTVEIEFDAEQPAFDVDCAYFKLVTDLGAAFDLPVGLTVTSGWFESWTQGYECVTGLETECVVDGFIADGEPASVAIGIGTDMVNLNVAFSVAELEDEWDMLIEADLPEIGPASADIYYSIRDNDEFKGAFGVEACATVDPVTIGVGFDYNTLLETWAYGVGASAGVSMATIGVGLNGNDVEALNQLGFDVNIAPADEYGLDVGALLSFAEGAETFQGFEGSAYYKAGAAEIRAGYLYTESGFAYKAENTSNDVGPGLGGGLFVRFDIDF